MKTQHIFDRMTDEMNTQRALLVALSGALWNILNRTFYKVLILFLGSTRIGFNVFMVIFFPFSFQSVINALFSSGLYEAPLSSEHNVL